MYKVIREEFNKLEVLEQLDYVNHELKKNKSLRIIGSNLKMSKTTFRDRFAKIGYMYNADLKEYTNDNNPEIQLHQKNVKSSQKTVKPNMEPIAKDNVEQKYKDDILELVQNKNELLEMLKNYKNNAVTTKTTEFNINNLPQELQTNILRKTLKIYEPIYINFDEVCNSYGNFKRQDLISLAILEFCNKYKK